MSHASVPLSAHELRDAIRHAQRFDPARLDRVLRTDRERGVIEVQAGCPWRTVAEHLRPGDEQAAKVGGGLPTVGTSVAWNAPGPDGRPAVRHIETITLVTADGELKRASRTANADLFAMTVGGLNLSGAIYSVTLRIDQLFHSLGEAADPTPPEAALRARSRRLQLLLPPDRTEDFLCRAREVCAEWRTDIARLKLRPTHADEETFLHWARRPYVHASLWLAIPRTLGGAVRTAQLCGELIGASLERGGSFAIAHTTDASREQVAACYPRLREFLAEKRRLDPAEKISNGWYRHYRGLLSRQACESRWNH